LKDYFQKSEYVLEKIWFDYLGGRYQGRGVLTWEPSLGFHLEALLERDKMPQIEQVELGRVRIIRKSDTSSIRMKPWYQKWAISPRVVLIDRDDILSQHRLSIDLSRVIFSTFSGIDSCTEWIGSAIYRTDNVYHLSDLVSQEIKIQDSRIETSRNFLGIFYQDENQKIFGRLIDKHHLQLNWSFLKIYSSKNFAWKWAEAAQDTLSILLGQTVQLLYRELLGDSQKRFETRRMMSVEQLDILSPFYGEHRLNKKSFVKLANFLAKNEPHSEVCRNVFRQIAESSRQKSSQAKEFLLSTILEAALRNIDKHPFKAKKDSWNVGQSLRSFLQGYFPEQWIPLHSQIMKSHTYLRDRNAHPDWLFSQGGSRSEDEREKALDSMVFLSRFYGYMILALAGFEGLEPYFPTPHQQWKPSLIMTPAK
jgi:hypothetical protein